MPEAVHLIDARLAGLTAAADLRQGHFRRVRHVAAAAAVPAAAGLSLSATIEGAIRAGRNAAAALATQ